MLWRSAIIWFARGLIVALPCLCAGAAEEPASRATSLVIVGIEGRVEVESEAQPQAAPMSPGTTLHLPCTIRTEAHSRLTLRAGDATILRVGAEAEMRFIPGTNPIPGVRLERGPVFFLHRDTSGQFEVETTNALVKVEGTGFSIRVAVNKTTTIALFDGQLDVSNSQGRTNLIGRSAAIVEPGQAPRATAALAMQRVIQWNLYYPAILDIDELELGPDIWRAIADSLAHYRDGNLLKALDAYPRQRQPASRAEQLYLAGLLLAVGDVDSAKPWIEQSADLPPGDTAKVTQSVQHGLERLLATVMDERQPEPESPGSAAEWLALSYYRQGRGDLPGALDAAKAAAKLRPNFAFPHVRVAELEFGSGRTPEAEESLVLALALAPEHAEALAIRGFVLAALNRHREARALFDQATLTDPSLANGWLGRGLSRIHAGDEAVGVQDLLTAAAVEPQRAVLRSYLAKAFQMRGLLVKADRELKEAERLDANDPTAWLYAALLKREEFRYNEAIEDLERSVRLNNNRQLFRSRLLLDQDRAVRNANLASIYRDAGMTDVGVREAANAVTSDYANYSAHLFLANSYNDLRDPSGVTLRYETATFSEYLLSNLLTPVGGSTLSPYVSQQEYSKLFEQDRVGFSSQTTYLSGGDWQQQASQYGWTKDIGYALDVYYRSQNGERPNNDLEQKAASIQVKQQLTSQDSVYLQAIFTDFESGDMRQLYDAHAASPNLRVTERQTPNLLAGYHHEWSPQLHTLLLVGRLEDWFSLTNTDVLIRGVVRDTSGSVVDTVEEINRRFNIDPPSSGDTFDRFKFRSAFEAYSAELQQIALAFRHTFIGGARFQSGETDSYANETRGAGRVGSPGTELEFAL